MMLMWKIVVPAEASVFFIYIYIDYLYMGKSYMEGYPPRKDLKNEPWIAVLNI